MCSWVALFLSVIVYYTELTNAQQTDVKLVHAVLRHGPRTPADTYPNDPHVDFDFAPYGWGQLTNDGKRAQYNQGKFLRERYDGTFGDVYSPNYVEVQTTGVDRTIMSAQLEMAGIWPPGPSQRWHPDIDWQPTAIYSTPLNADRLLLVRVPCPKYYMELEKVMKGPEVERKLEELGASQLYEELTNLTGMTINSPDDVLSLYGTLTAERDFNLTLPDWTNDYYTRLEPITALSFGINGYSKVLTTIKGGPLVKKIIKDTQNKIDGANKRTLHMYVGHDSTIANLLIALGVWDPQIPGYGIMTLLELHQERESGQYGIKVFLRNSTAHEPYPLTLPGCDHFCPFSEFVKLTKDVIPDDLDSFCKVDDPNYVPPPPPPP